MDKKFFVSVCGLIIAGLAFVVSAVIYPIKFGEMKKQVEINALVSQGYSVDIVRLEQKLNLILIETKEVKAYLRAKDGGLLE